MRAAYVSCVLLAVALVGFLTGALLQPFESAAPSPVAGLDSASLAPAASGTSPRPSATVNRGAAQAQEIPAAIGQQELEEILARATAPSPMAESAAPASAAELQGVLPIEGAVLDESGSPLAGFEVLVTPSHIAWRSAYAESAMMRSGSDDAREIRSSLSRMARELAHKRRAQRTVKTDALGKFRVDVPPEGTYVCESAQPRWLLLERRSESLAHVEAGDRLELSATRLYSVSVSLRETNGDALSSGWLIVDGAGGWSANVAPWTRGDPPLWLRPASYAFRATREGVGGSWTPPLVVEVKPADAPLEVEIRFPPASRIEGRITWGGLRELGWEGLRVDVSEAREEDDPSPSIGLGGRRAQLAFVDGELEFHVEGLHPGSASITVHWHDGRMLLQQPAAIAPGSQRVDLVVPWDEAARVVELAIADSQGAALLQAEVSVDPVAAEDQVPDETDVSAFADEKSPWVVPAQSGSWKIVHPSAMLRDGSRFELRIQAAEHARYRREYDAAVDARLDVRLEPVAELQIRLNRAIHGQLLLRRADPSKGSQLAYVDSEFMGEEDTASFEGLSPGAHVVAVRMRSSGVEYTVLEQAVTLGPGKNELPLELPILYGLTVTAPDPAMKGHLWLLRIDGGSALDVHAKLAQGRAQFEQLPAGSYQLRCRLDGVDRPQHFTLQVPATTSIMLDGPAPNWPATPGYRVTSILPASASYAAGLRLGDVLISVGGHSLQELSTALGLFNGAPYFIQGATLEGGVQRGGTVLNLALPRSLFADYENSGVALEFFVK